MGKIEKLEKLIISAAKRVEGMPIALSGGLDSSLLAALIKPKFAINVRLPGGSVYDESKSAKFAAKYLDIKLCTIRPKRNKFDEVFPKAVRIIGRPIPHFNIFPLYEMFRVLKERFGEKDLVVGDGPDESMCGYTRHLIMNYLFNAYKIEAFENYSPTINKFFPKAHLVYYDLIGKEPPKDHPKLFLENLLKWMCRVDMELMRPDMDEMSGKLAKYFGIKIHRPYETKKVDDFMFNLPGYLKISEIEYGKYALRLIAEKYLPKRIVWNKTKRGGPVYPVNKIKGWMKNGEFDKTEYLKEQERILKE